MSNRAKKATCAGAITMAAASTARARIGHPSKRRRSNATPQRGQRERGAAGPTGREASARAERERARPRYEPKRVASPRLTDEERQAIERARAEKRPAAEREREEERARAKAERTRAEGEASPSRRARGQEALLSFSADEAAAIEAAIAAGKVTKIKRPIDV